MSTIRITTQSSHKFRHKCLHVLSDENLALQKLVTLLGGVRQYQTGQRTRQLVLGMPKISNS